MNRVVHCQPIAFFSQQRDLDFFLALSRDGPPLFWCRGSCAAWMVPGRYWARVAGSSTVLGGQRSFELKGPASVEIVPRTPARRRGGLALGIAGIGLAVGGAVLWVSGAAASTDSEFGGTGTGVELLGLGALIAGAILTPIGWVRYGGKAPAVVVESAVPDEYDVRTRDAIHQHAYTSDGPWRQHF